jgi:hypothetical protein
MDFLRAGSRLRTGKERRMPKSTISVVPIGTRVCKPFLLEVVVFADCR